MFTPHVPCPFGLFTGNTFIHRIEDLQNNHILFRTY